METACFSWQRKFGSSLFPRKRGKATATLRLREHRVDDSIYPLKLTVKVKLLPTADEKQSLLKTMERFNQACDYISKVAFENKKFGQVDLHHLCYREVRDTFNLASQFTVRAIGKVSESYRANKKTLHKFKKLSAIVYDDRLLSFSNLSIASILTVDGRRKIPVIFGEYAKLEQKRILKQADMMYSKGNFFLCLVIDLPDGSKIEPKGYLGVDMGIVNLASTSDEKHFSGKDVDNVRIKIHTLKKALQAKGTKNAKRHLKKLSGRERRFKRNTNHSISKQIVSIAKGTQQAIGLEDLKGFRVTVTKAQRERFGKWSFDELRGFIEYKAQIEGIPVIAVDPRNTSRTCSCCGHCDKANRKSQSEFVCKVCHFSINADFNAAINISVRASVNVPIAAGVSRRNASRRTEPQAVCFS